MWALLLVALLYTDPPPLNCGVITLLTHNDTINFSDSATNCMFAMRYEMSPDGELMIFGEHWVAVIQIPKNANSHWLTYQWRAATASYNGESLSVVHYYRHDL